MQLKSRERLSAGDVGPRLDVCKEHVTGYSALWSTGATCGSRSLRTSSG